MNNKKYMCYICYNNNYTINLKCTECLQCICIECCNNLESRRTIIIDDKLINIKYKCPFCRKENIKNIKKFEKDEIEICYLKNLKNYIELYNLNINNENEILFLNSNNEILKELIIAKDNEIYKQRKKIKNLININKNNMINYDILLEHYKKYIKIL